MTNKPVPTRTLKIEETGDPFFGGIKPKIRLQGKWLERLGFKAGSRVEIRPHHEPGQILLVAIEPYDCGASRSVQ